MIGCALLLVFAAQGCKDTSGSVVNTTAAKERDCIEAINASNWDLAITTCSTVGTDEGYHYSAQAYMAKAGVILDEAALTSLSSDPSLLLDAYIPDTAEKSDSLRSALDQLMGVISEKSAYIYFESMIVSSLLIYNELNQVVNAFVEPTADIAGPSIIFYGLDPADSTADFYQDLCGSVADNIDVTDTSHDGTTIKSSTTPTVTDFVYDVTVDSCVISHSSPFYYNKLANEGYIDSGSEAITELNFYNQINTGTNFSIDFGYGDLPVITFCEQIDPPEASDDALNDCEVLGALSSLGFSL